MTNEELAYFTGFFEGEGSISLHGHGNKPRKRDGVVARYLVLTLYQKSEECLRRIQSFAGGNLRQHAKRPPANMMYRLNWSGQEAIDLLVAMLPHMRHPVRIEKSGIALATTNQINRYTKHKTNRKPL